MIYEITYSAEQKQFLERLTKVGAVLETVILQSHQRYDICNVCKLSALEGMRILAERHLVWFQKINPELNIKDYFFIQIFPNEDLTCNEISFKDFVGSGYDLETESLDLFSYDSNGGVIYHKETEGLAKALLNPPYSLRFVRSGDFADEKYEETENQFFTEIIQTYLRVILRISNYNETRALTILSWSDNWSNYFEDGKEWWGTFCWTIYDTRDNRIIFITASSTD